MPNSSQLGSSVSTCARESASRICALTGVPSVGTLWSAVASVRSGRRTSRPASRRPVEGLRARDLVDEVEVDEEQPVRDLVGGPELVEQRGGGHERRRPADTMASRTASSSPRVVEVMGQVGVEGHAVAGVQRVRGAVDVQCQRAVLDDGGLARAGLVPRRVAGAAGDRARGERVAGDLGALTGQRRGQDLVGVPGRPAAAILAAAHDRDRPLLVEAQQLGEPQLQPGRDARGDLQRRAGLPALDLGEHRRRDAGALREVAQREVHRLPQRLHARPDGRDGGVGSRRHYVCTLSRTCGRASLGWWG